MELPAPETETRETGVAGFKHVVDEKDIVLCKQNKNIERTANRVTRIFKLRCIPHACLCDEFWWSRSPQQSFMTDAGEWSDIIEFAAPKFSSSDHADIHPEPDFDVPPIGSGRKKCD